MSILVEVIVSAFFSLLVSNGEDVKPEVGDKVTTEMVSQVDENNQC